MGIVGERRGWWRYACEAAGDSALEKCSGRLTDHLEVQATLCDCYQC